jgi:hypothetical protein
MKPIGTLVPAYGRDYKSKAAIEADFNAGKDFYLQGINGCGLVNKEAYSKGDNVTVRYSKLTKATIIKVK